MPNYPAQIRYKEKNIVHCTFDLNRATDAELIEHIQKQPNRAAYLKELVKKDMEYQYAVININDDDFTSGSSDNCDGPSEQTNNS